MTTATQSATITGLATCLRCHALVVARHDPATGRHALWNPGLTARREIVDVLRGEQWYSFARPAGMRHTCGTGTKGG